MKKHRERDLAHCDQRVVTALDDENAYWKTPHARMDHIAYRFWLALPHNDRTEPDEK